MHITDTQVCRGAARRGFQLTGSGFAVQVNSELSNLKLDEKKGADQIDPRLAGVPTHKSAEPGSLGVRIDFEQRPALLREAPQTYYITDHYRDYPAVLVRLSRIDEGALRDLLGAAHRFVTVEVQRKSSARRKSAIGRKKKLTPR